MCGYKENPECKNKKIAKKNPSGLRVITLGSERRHGRTHILSKGDQVGIKESDPGPRGGRLQLPLFDAYRIPPEDAEKH